MGRTIESVHGFTHTPKFRLSKEVVAVRCEDGAVYQFEKPKGRPRWDFTKSFAPDGTMKIPVRERRSPALLRNWPTTCSDRKATAGRSRTETFLRRAVVDVVCTSCVQTRARVSLE